MERTRNEDGNGAGTGDLEIARVGHSGRHHDRDSMKASLRRLAPTLLSLLVLLLLLYALGGSEGRRRRLREATRLVFGAAIVRPIGPNSLDAETADAALPTRTHISKSPRSA